jgi:signal transduction histidine kinase
LAIVRDLVRAHGGDVSLESAPGAGTVVRCRFPIAG